MKFLGSKSRLILDLLVTTGLDALDFTLSPTRALLRSGGWEDDYRMRRHLLRMQEAGLIRCEAAEGESRWVVKVTELGKRSIAEDVDPDAAWARSWDGRWRFISFDLPTSTRARRRDLNLWLRKRRFGRLQGSLWIVPTFPADWSEELAAFQLKPSRVSFIEGQPFATSADADLVATAWRFERINQAYRQLIDFHEQPANRSRKDWLAAEYRLWRAAVEADPFLPEPLLPEGYLGKLALLARRRAFA